MSSVRYLVTSAENALSSSTKEPVEPSSVGDLAAASEDFAEATELGRSVGRFYRR